MRVLFVCSLADDSATALAPLAAACEDAGHDVAFAVAPSLVPQVEADGFEALPAGLDVEAEPDHIAAALAGDLAPLTHQWGAGLVVHHDSEGARLGAGRASLTAVCVSTRPAAGDFSLLPPSFQPTPQPRLRLLRPGPFPDSGDGGIAVGAADWAFVMRALLADRPLVMGPRDDDERYLAFRVVAAGAGLLAGPDAVRDVLDDPLFYGNAQRLRREIEAMPGPPDVVALLAALA